jgi:hypothetical protein
MSIAPRIRYYLLFTAGFSACWFLFKFGGMQDLRKAVASTAIDTLLNVGMLAATVEWLMPRYFLHRRYGRFAAGFALLVLLAGTANIFGQIYLMNANLHNYQARMTNPREHFFYWFWCDLVAGSYFMLAVIGLGACAICLAFERIRTTSRLAQVESDRLRWELEAVKHRTNPHFIFNTLNTIYYSIEAHNQPARMLTETFAGLLRHQLYDCNEATVRIEQELRCIEAYVSLQQQRAGPAIQVHCRGLDAAGGFCIPPHLLIPLVENCFKHVSRHADRPNTIHLHAAVTNNRFVFYTHNTCTTAIHGRTNGIGLALVRRQLELLGMNSAALTTARHEAHFETSLTLALS